MFLFLLHTLENQVPKQLNLNQANKKVEVKTIQQHLQNVQVNQLVVELDDIQLKQPKEISINNKNYNILK